MKKKFDLVMKVLLGITLGLVLVLGVSVVIIGPRKTERAIKALFTKSKYNLDYDKDYPDYADSEVQNYLHADAENEEAEETGDLEKGKVLGTQKTRIDPQKSPPLIVPSTGLIPVQEFTYTGPASQGGHEAIDIWTHMEGRGADGESYGRGNPVYAACSGFVRNIFVPDGDISIICDPIDQSYKDYLPSLEIKTLYGHMADRDSNRLYINVKEGQRVKQGQLIGYQGNRANKTPESKVVHLHFGVYDISKGKQIPLDPSKYIGVNCRMVNQTFKAGVNEK